MWALPLLTLVVPAASTSCDATPLLQLVRPPTDRSDAGLKDLAERLLWAKGQCLQSTMECLPALKQVRFRAWFFAQDLVQPKKKSWPIVDLHPEVLRAKAHCGGHGTSLLFLDLSTDASKTTRQTLTAKAPTEVVKAMEEDVRWCEKLQLPSDRQSQVTFTMVQEPLSRFIAAYANVEAASHHSDSFEFLQAQEGTVERAKLFVDYFVKFGDQLSSQVKPQSEHLAPVSAGCGLKLDFIGKSEHFARDWKAFFDAKHCDMVPIEDATPELSTVSLKQSRDRSASAAAMMEAFQANSSAYLRAFCWIHLADYVIFDYDLPKGCDEAEMLKIVSLTKHLGSQSLA